MSGRFAFHDLEEKDFPFTATFSRFGEQIYQIHAEGPGDIVVPPLGADVDVRVEWGDGTTTYVASTEVRRAP